MLNEKVINLYHTEVGFPNGFTSPKGVYGLEWSQHADRARCDDRYGYIEKFATIDTKNFTVIEVGFNSVGRPVKIVLRGELDNKFDITFVLIPRAGSWLVKTVWLNYWNDTHKTLDQTKYTKP